MPPDDAPAAPSSSRRSRKSADSSRKRTRIVVQLRARPAPYVPRSGPRLEPPRLQLPSDSTAYIVDRILLPSPGPAADGRPLPRRMTYIVGWHDLPAARALVPAMRILEYVSPLVLEEWEWQLELGLDEERGREQELPASPPLPPVASSPALAKPILPASLETKPDFVMQIPPLRPPRPQRTPDVEPLPSYTPTISLNPWTFHARAPPPPPPEQTKPASLAVAFPNKWESPKPPKKPDRKKKKTVQSTLPWAMKRKYNSVSEAFADFEDDDEMGVYHTHSQDEASDKQTELFVVEEESAVAIKSKSKSKSKSKGQDRRGNCSKSIQFGFS
ncbi:hypothetical protein B0I35DRAFT_57475 [Stachybotrys elegans]|uniref:Chromo domain-containing protein n=1 Tax=Stachybotrys elegans TaxID=80388 RepID=A0A8K0WNP0_9HYPO|nr:hypothetical protein B0I35DRAFT_57475 [Stachybotrys elegans]